MPARGNLDAPKPRKRSAKRRSTSAPTLASGGKRQVRDIARQIRSAISLDDVLTGVVAEAGQALGADVAVVRLRENTAGATWARPGATAGAVDVREDLLHAMTGDDIVDVDDLSNDPLVWAAARHRLGAALGVPLSAADKVVGHLVLSTAARTAWPEHDLASLVTLAPDIAAAIEHAQLYDRERTMVQQLQELDWPAYITKPFVARTLTGVTVRP